MTIQQQAEKYAADHGFSIIKDDDESAASHKYVVDAFLAGAEMKGKSAGVKWVKCADRMPPINDRICRLIGCTDLLDSYDFHVKANRMEVNVNDWEWLDESGSSAGERGGMKWLDKIQPDFDHPGSYQLGFHDAIEVVKKRLESTSAEEEAVAFADFIAAGNYEYCISPDGKGNEIVEWNEVEDPQLHGEDGPEEYRTTELYQLFKQRK